MAVTHCLLYGYWLSLTVSYMVAGCGPMELLHVSHCLLLLLALSHSLLYCCWLSLTVFPVPCSCWLSLTVSYIVADCLSTPHLLLLAVSHCLSLQLGVAACHSLSPIFAALAVSHCISGPMELQHVSHCLLYGCWLSVTIFLVPWSCCMTLAVYYGCWVSFTVSYLCWQSLTVTYIVAGCLSLSLRSHGFAECLSLSHNIAGCFSLSLPVSWSCCIVSHYLLLLLH